MITSFNPDSWVKDVPAKPRNYLLPVLEHDEPQATGEGLTRTSKAGANLFDMVVHFNSSRPMRTTIRALTWAQAEQFARNRHPDLARIERLPQTGRRA
jgi:hypothetical protein